MAMAAEPVLLGVSHHTRYRYGAPVSLAHHLAHLKPLADAHQELLDFELEVEPAPAQMAEETDALGNTAHHFSLTRSHTELAVRATSQLRVAPRFDALDAQASPPWESVAERLRYVARSQFEPAAEFTVPSPFVPRLAALRERAAGCFTPGRPIAAAALELMHRIHAEFEYAAQSTKIDTPLYQVLAEKRGVCQDFAHLMAGTVRMLGLPARYVSGYLLTHSLGTALVGADASHAWVQVWCPGTPGVPADGWLDLDPTNDIVPSTGHVRVALGRDFGDVTPLRGVIRGGGHHELFVAVSVQPVEAPSAAGTRVANL